MFQLVIMKLQSIFKLTIIAKCIVILNMYLRQEFVF